MYYILFYEKNQTALFSCYVEISRQNGRTKRNDDRGREELSICRRIESRIVYVERDGRIFDLPNRDGSEFQLTWLLIRDRERTKRSLRQSTRNSDLIQAEMLSCC